MAEILVATLAYLTLALDVSIILYLSIKVVEKFTGKPFNEYFSRLEKFLERYYQELGFALASVATVGSLYLSNILGWTPCRLCWFQRIFMYPLVLILGVSIFLNRENVEEYVLPLSLTGIGISAYHYAVQRISQFNSAGCSITEVSCETKYTFYFGYVSVPMMALTAFAGIIILMYLGWKKL